MFGRNKKTKTENMSNETTNNCGTSRTTKNSASKSSTKRTKNCK